MTPTQRWIVRGTALCLLLVLLAPPWHYDLQSTVVAPDHSSLGLRTVYTFAPLWQPPHVRRQWREGDYEISEESVAYGNAVDWLRLALLAAAVLGGGAIAYHQASRARRLAPGTAAARRRAALLVGLVALVWAGAESLVRRYRDDVAFYFADRAAMAAMEAYGDSVRAATVAVLRDPSTPRLAGRWRARLAVTDGGSWLTTAVGQQVELELSLVLDTSSARDWVFHPYRGAADRSVGDALLAFLPEGAGYVGGDTVRLVEARPLGGDSLEVVLRGTGIQGVYLLGVVSGGTAAGRWSTDEHSPRARGQFQLVREQP